LFGVLEAGRGIVIFAHGSGSDRLSPRNNHAATALRSVGLATLLLDLLTPSQEQDRRNVFDIGLLASRLTMATHWAASDESTENLVPIYFGASTGATAALTAASHRDAQVAAIVSAAVGPIWRWTVCLLCAPTLLPVGSLDSAVIELNQCALGAAYRKAVRGHRRRAGHLSEEPGTLGEVVKHATNWFLSHMEGCNSPDRIQTQRSESSGTQAGGGAGRTCRVRPARPCASAR